MLSERRRFGLFAPYFVLADVSIVGTDLEESCWAQDVLEETIGRMPSPRRALRARRACRETCLVPADMHGILYRRGDERLLEGFARGAAGVLMALFSCEFPQQAVSFHQQIAAVLRARLEEDHGRHNRS